MHHHCEHTCFSKSSSYVEAPRATRSTGAREAHSLPTRLGSLSLMWWHSRDCLSACPSWQFAASSSYNDTFLKSLRIASNDHSFSSNQSLCDPRMSTGCTANVEPYLQSPYNHSSHVGANSHSEAIRKKPTRSPATVTIVISAPIKFCV